MGYVTWEALIAFCGLIVSIILLVVEIMRKK